MTLRILAAMTVIGVIVAGLTAASTLTHQPPAAPQCETVHSLRIIDAQGRTTAFIGNVADGSSPAILLYDRRGNVRSAVMVDSVTGELVKIPALKCRATIGRNAPPGR